MHYCMFKSVSYLGQRRREGGFEGFGRTPLSNYIDFKKAACVYLAGHRKKKSNTFCYMGDSNSGPLAFKASSTTTAPAAQTPVI